MTLEQFKKLALSFPESAEEPHFEKTSFRFRKKIFATLDESKQVACLMLSPEDQSVFVLFDRSVVYPVPNKWGLKGATYVELATVDKNMLKDALSQAYKHISTKK